MPIKIKVNGPLMCPMFFCDVCGEEIRDYQKGAYVYNGLGTNVDHPGELSFVHKGNCLDVIDEKFKSKDFHLSWNGLGEFLVFLVQNTGVKSFNKLKGHVESWNFL